MKDFIFRSAIELAGLIRDRKASSTEIVRAHLDHIKEHNPTIGAIAILLEEQAMKEAAACDQEAASGDFRGPLHGVPMTIKEQFWLKGTKSTLNTNRLKDWIAPEDAVIVKRLKDAGAIILGKTNVAKDLLDYQVKGDIYPEGKNPYDREHSPGGSSGGAAAALASGMIPIELGGDFGGSIRIPANFCGVYGLKPTEKTIPGHGSTPQPKGSKGHVFDMAVGGPMARTPEDVELLWKVLKGPDVKDRSVPPIDWINPEGKQLSDYKIAWVDGWPDYETSEQSRTVMKDLVSLLAEKGVQTVHSPPAGDLHHRGSFRCPSA